MEVSAQTLLQMLMFGLRAPDSAENGASDPVAGTTAVSLELAYTLRDRRGLAARVGLRLVSGDYTQRSVEPEAFVALLLSPALASRWRPSVGLEFGLSGALTTALEPAFHAPGSIP